MTRSYHCGCAYCGGASDGIKALGANEAEVSGEGGEAGLWNAE